jgi:two-component system, LytTR family, response regulator LytT
MKILIIEDEKLTSEDLKETILKIDSKIDIVGILHSVKDAISWFRKNESPDLIISDIQLGDGLSFEIFNKVHCHVPVIFCTAFDMYALDAFKVNGIDYLLKPFTQKSISDALNKYNVLKSSFSRSTANFDHLLELFTKQKFRNQGSILVYYKDKITPVKVEDIALFYIENEITHILTFDQKNYSVNKTLDELESISSPQFYRINRQNLLNRKAIKDASHYFARKLSISLIIPFKENLIVSKEKVTDFLMWLSDY